MPTYRKFPAWARSPAKKSRKGRVKSGCSGAAAAVCRGNSNCNWTKKGCRVRRSGSKGKKSKGKKTKSKSRSLSNSSRSRSNSRKGRVLKRLRRGPAPASPKRATPKKYVNKCLQAYRVCRLEETHKVLRRMHPSKKRQSPKRSVRRSKSPQRKASNAFPQQEPENKKKHMVLPPRGVSLTDEQHRQLMQEEAENLAEFGADWMKFLGTGAAQQRSADYDEQVREAERAEGKVSRRRSKTRSNKKKMEFGPDYTEEKLERILTGPPRKGNRSSRSRSKRRIAPKQIRGPSYLLGR